MSSNKDPQEYQLPEPVYHAGGPHFDAYYSADQVRAAFAAGLAAAKPKKAAKPKAGEPPKPADVTDQTWTDFLALRKAKKATLSGTALSMIESAATKAGYTLEDALRICCERGWQAFRADWVTPQKNPRGGSLSGMNYGDRDGHFNQ